MKKRNTVSYNQIIAGIVYRFGSVNQYEFSLVYKLIEKKLEEMSISIDLSWNGNKDNNTVFEYLEYTRDGDIILKGKHELNTVVKDNKTLKELLKSNSEEAIINIVDSIDISKFAEESKNDFEENKEDVLENANVLLISEEEDDYKSALEYGFKNIDYFKSVIRANDYFLPTRIEDLEQYNLVILGNRSVTVNTANTTELERLINEMDAAHRLLKVSVFDYHLFEPPKYSLFFQNKRVSGMYNLSETEYEEVYNRILENTIMNDMMIETGHKKRLPEYKDSINPNKLPLPKKKEDIKILCLYQHAENYLHEIEEELGLNITFMPDDNFSLEKINRLLGEYDIIIASSMFSSKLLSFNIESTEQCKDTGRSLVLLLTNEDKNIGLFDENKNYLPYGIGDKVKIKYTFAGELATTPEGKQTPKYQKEYNVYRHDINSSKDDENIRDYDKSCYCDLKSVIQSAVTIYNKQLINTKNEPLENLDLKDPDSFTEEYASYEHNFNSLKEDSLKSVTKMHDLNRTIVNYIYNIEHNYTNKIPKDLKIEEPSDGIKITIYNQNRTIATLKINSVSRCYTNYFEFELQYLTNKNRLSQPIKLAYYTSTFDGKEDVPPRPNDQQEKVINSIINKILTTLNPINDEVKEVPPLETPKQKKKK